MKKRFIQSMAALGVTLGVASTAGAQSLPGSGWFTSVTFQNVSSTPNEVATLNLEAYPQANGAAAITGSASINPGESATFLPGQTGAGFVSLNLPANFQGSMVVSSNAPVKAITQVGNNLLSAQGLGTAGGQASAQFDSMESAAKTVTYPTMKAGFGNKVTIVSLQAAGGDVSYTATINDNAGGTHTKTGSIQANRAILLDPRTFTPPLAGTGCGTDANTTACLGAMTVNVTSGAGSLVGALVETQSNVTPATVGQATYLFTPADAASTVYCSVVKHGYTTAQNRHSGITVQNVGTTSTQVSLKLDTDPALGANPNQTYTQPAVTVAPGKSFTFLGPTSNTLGNMPRNNYAAATITASGGGQIIAAVNESNFEGPGVLKAVTYACSGAQKATGKIAFPQVKENYNRSTTSVTIQNVGAAATTVNVVYSCRTAAGQLTTNTLSTGSLAPGKAKVFFSEGSIPDNTLCSATATAANPATDKIIGLAQETSDPFGSLLDTKNYEGFNLAN